MNRLFGLAALALLSVAACAAPTAVEEEGQSGTGSALSQGETEVMSLVTGVPSTTEGVDEWRLSYVRKAGVATPFPVAIGSKDGKEVIDVIIVQNASGKRGVRLVTDLEVTKSMTAAIGADLITLRDAAIPEAPPAASTGDTGAERGDAGAEPGGETGTASVHVLTASKSRSCSREWLLAGLTFGTTALTALGVTAACGSTPFTTVIGAAACVVTVSSEVVAINRQIKAGTELLDCLDP